MRLTDVLNLVVAARPMLQGAVVPKIMPKLVIVLLLTVLVGILASAISLGLFYVGYLALIAHAVDPMNALLITIGVAVILLVIGVAILRRSLCKLKSSAVPSTDGISQIIDAFLEGLGTSKRD